MPNRTIAAVEAGGTKFILALADEAGTLLERSRIDTAAPDVTLPAATKANLRLRSDNGQLFTDFDFTAQVAEVKESREQGHTMKEIGKYIGGAINGGGPVFELRSFNGDVYVRKGAK